MSCPKSSRPSSSTEPSFTTPSFQRPGAFARPPLSTVAPYLSPHSKHVIIYHLLTEGLGYAQVEGDDRPLPLAAGDIVIFPHGDPHIMRNGSPVKPVDNAQELQRVLAQGLKVSRMGGGGEITKFICGYMTCDPQLSRIFLGGLPPVLKVSIRNDASGQWLENSIRYSVDNADASRPGGEAVLAKLSEVLFVETLRRYIALLPREQTGWLAGVRDPEVGKALALLASQAGPSVDDRRTRERGRNVAFRTGRAFPALSLGDPHCLPHTLAASARRATAQIHEQ